MIQLRDIYFKYSKQKRVLNNINLDIHKGLIYGLLGKNGEGKTTLINLMSGLLFPDRGTCRVLGEEPAKRQVPFLRQIFLLPEEILLPDVTAAEYFKMYAPFYPSFNKSTYETCIQSFEIELSASIRKMSQGQKKKVAITMALAAQTPLLFMDEPTNGLDIPSKSIFRRLIASSITEEQAVIISTHQVRDLESLIDSVIIIDNKEIVFNRTLDEISSRLDFRKTEDGEKTLYSEITPAGTIGVVKNDTGEKSLVPLELLFNATVSDKQEIKQLLNN